jgi:sugar phosphate isomerase/epimerase
MARPVILFTGQWTDLPLEELAQRAAEWGYQGLELCTWGDHFEVQRALSEDDYCQAKLDLLARHELTAPVLAAHRVGQAVADPIDARHQGLLPDYVWGDGDPEAVRQRAAAEMIATVRAAQRLGVAVVSGFTGSPLWAYVCGYPAPGPEVVSAGLAEFARRWEPVLDACRDAGVRFAAEVHPGQVAFDLYSAEMALDAVGGREEFGFTFDPSHLHWQGVDPAEFVRRFPDRIYHVHIKDAVLALNGRSGVLGSYLPYGDPRRGWDFRAPGRGGIDWEAVVRALNDAGYDGPLAVEWKDAGVQRDYGTEEACKFVKRLDFEPARRGPGPQAFREG